MDPDMEHHYKGLLHQWKNDEDNIKDELKEIGTDVKNLSKKLDDLVTSTVTPVREINDKGTYIQIDTLRTRTISANTDEDVN